LVAILAKLRAQIAIFDRRIAELFAVHPDGALFGSLPGAGAARVPRLMVAFGTQRESYQSGLPNAALYRHRSGHRGQWQPPMGACPLCRTGVARCWLEPWHYPLEVGGSPWKASQKSLQDNT
jgi:hypothetical protein